MAETVHTATITIYLNHGEPIRAVVEADEAKLLGISDDIEKALERHSLVLLLDGKLLQIPYTSIRSIEIDPAPPNLPNWLLRGRRA